MALTIDSQLSSCLFAVAWPAQNRRRAAGWWIITIGMIAEWMHDAKDDLMTWNFVYAYA